MYVKRVINIFVVVLAVVSLAGCGRPKVIPKSELREIFRESFLANAYYGTNTFIATDSLDIYRPILAKYGYTYRDLEKTVADFSKQKSAKLSDVIKAAIEDLRAESKYYDGLVATLDTIDARNARRFMQEVLYTERIEVREIADTADLRITLPAEPGKYAISYVYDVDSLEQNTGLRSIVWLVDSRGQQKQVVSNYMNARKRQQNRSEFEAGTDDREVLIVMANYRNEMKRPYLTFDSLRVEHYLPRDAARDSVPKLFQPSMFRYHAILPDSLQADSVPLRIHPVRIDSTGVGDA